jgi:hypothetical protein
MNKMAMFFEGRTELEFSSKLIQEIASHRAITIESRTLKGATTRDRSSRLINVVNTDATGKPSTHFIMLYNCVGESAVKSRMMAEYPSLADAGYSEIVCQRDVAPNVPRDKIAELEKGLPLFVRTKPIGVTFILSVMEVEAWFIAEHTHFPQIDAILTLPAVAATLGIDPSVDDVEKLDAPADDLNRCYGLAGIAYTKETSQQTIDAIDCASVYLEIQERIPYLKRLCDVIDRFLGQ